MVEVETKYCIQASVAPRNGACDMIERTDTRIICPIKRDWAKIRPDILVLTD